MLRVNLLAFAFALIERESTGEKSENKEIMQFFFSLKSVTEENNELHFH